MHNIINVYNTVEENRSSDTVFIFEIFKSYFSRGLIIAISCIMDRKSNWNMKGPRKCECSLSTVSNTNVT